MATTARQDAAGRRIKTKGEAPLAAIVEKEITPTMERYSAWLKDQTGYDVDQRSVQLAGGLRSQFQKSDVNQAALAEAKVANEQLAADRAQRALDREAAREAKAAAKAAKAAEPKDEKVVKEKPAPKAKVAAKPAAKTTPVRKVSAAKTGVSKVTPAAKPAARRRPAKPAATEDVDF